MAVNAQPNVVAANVPSPQPVGTVARAQMSLIKTRHPERDR